MATADHNDTPQVPDSAGGALAESHAQETVVVQHAIRLWLFIVPVSLAIADLLLFATLKGLLVDRMLIVNAEFAVVSMVLFPWVARHFALRVSNHGIAGPTIWGNRVALSWADSCHFRVRRIGGIRSLEAVSDRSRASAIAPLFALDRESLKRAIHVHLPEGHPASQELISVLRALEEVA